MHTETGQRLGDTELLVHSRNCYGQPDLIHELTASVILERGQARRRKGPPETSLLANLLTESLLHSLEFLLQVRAELVFYCNYQGVEVFLLTV